VTTRSKASSSRPSLTTASRSQPVDHGTQVERVRPGRGLGAGEHPRSTLGRLRPARGLRHVRYPHSREGLRRLRFQQRRPLPLGFRGQRLQQGCAHGWRPEPRVEEPVPKLPRPRATGSRRRQPRPFADRQGMARCEWRGPRADLRHCRLRRPHHRRQWPLQDPVGNTVDLDEATYSNAIGAATLGGYWRDPDFDPTQRAFYYVRVLEIPTPKFLREEFSYTRNAPTPRRSGIRLPAESRWLSG
jgi:hypothetical protein